MRSLILVLLASAALAAAPWKLVLKDGRTVLCDGAPIVIDGTYMYRDAEGQDGSVPAADVDVDKTDAANRTDSKTRWREIGHTEQRAPQERFVGGGGVLTLSDANFGAQVLRSRVPVLVDFWATWCGPCKHLAPTVDALAGQYAGRIGVGRLDVDRNEATAKRYGVHAYPTLLLFKDGAVVGKIVGAADRREIAQMIEQNL